MRSLWWSLSTDGQWRVIKGFVCALALVAMGGGVLLAQQGWSGRTITQPFPDGVITTGTIVDWSMDGSSRAGEVYTPTIEFHDREGGRHVFRGPRSYHQLEVGDLVSVSYVPADPSRAHDLSADAPPWRERVVVGVAVILGVPLLALWVRRWWRRPVRIASDG